MISFIGGTGPEGRGLALRFAIIGEHIFLGSRDPQRGVAAAADVRTLLPRNYPSDSVMGGTNEGGCPDGRHRLHRGAVLRPEGHPGRARDAPSRQGHRECCGAYGVCEGLGACAAGGGGSAAEEARDLLPESSVIGAFHNLSAIDLLMPMQGLDCDVVVCGDDPEGKAKVMELAESIKGVRAVNGGALVNSRYVEHLTSLLININRIYKAHSSIRITGI